MPRKPSESIVALQQRLAAAESTASALRLQNSELGTHVRLMQQASESPHLPGKGMLSSKPWRPPKTTLVLANMSDAHPCPHTEFEALGPEHIFLAGSVALGTNMHNLWRLVEQCAKPRQEAEPAAGGDGGETSLRPDSFTMDTSPERTRARRRRDREIAAA